MREALTSLHEVWTRHIVETEAPGAFLDELVGEAPRLSTPAARLRREHNEILGVITRAEKWLDQVLLDDDHDVWVDGLRADLTSMLCAAGLPPPAGRRSHFRRLRRRHRRRLSAAWSLEPAAGVERWSPPDLSWVVACVTGVSYGVGRGIAEVLGSVWRHRLRDGAEQPGTAVTRGGLERR